MLLFFYLLCDFLFSQGRLKFTARKESMMSISSTETPSDASSSNQFPQQQHFTKSIEEIDRRLKSMDDRQPALDMTIKVPSKLLSFNYSRYHPNFTFPPFIPVESKIISIVSSCFVFSATYSVEKIHPYIIILFPNCKKKNVNLSICLSKKKYDALSKRGQFLCPT